MSDFDSVLFLLSVIAGLMLMASMIYLRFKEWRKSNSHDVVIYIPYLNVFIKPVYLYSSIALAFVLFIYFK